MTWRWTGLKVLAAGFVVYAIFHFGFLWMFEHGDSWYYLAFARYIQTGIYPFQFPFIYQNPTTIAAPFYSLILLPFLTVPGADIMLHAVQLLMLGATAYLLYRMLIGVASERSAGIIALVFLLIPANSIYVSYVMTEIPAQLAVTYVLYLGLRYARTKSGFTLGSIVFLTAVMTLLRYQFFSLFAISSSVYFFKYRRRILRPGKHAMFVVLGFAVVGSWILINHRITGVWGLSDTTKIRFHAAYVHFGRYFPERSDQAVIEYYRYVPETANPYAAWWDVQQYILPSVGNDWRKIDEIVGNVGIAAIKENPLGYLGNSIRIFYTMHISQIAPWWHDAKIAEDRSGGVYCRIYDAFRFCNPLIRTPVSFRVWNGFIDLAASLYARLFPLFAVFILLPSIVICLVTRKRSDTVLSLVYLIPLSAASFSITPEPRYLFPFYPVMVMLVVTTVRRMQDIIRSHWNL